MIDAERGKAADARATDQNGLVDDTGASEHILRGSQIGTFQT